MTERPILRFTEPTQSERRTGSPRNPPQPRGPGRDTQTRRFQGTFDRLSNALETDSPEVILREDPAGIAPERALVFIVAGSVKSFSRAANTIGLEVFAESELEAIEEIPDGFTLSDEGALLPRTLYATMPTLEVFNQLLTLWGAYQRGEAAPTGFAPWWNTFDLLLEIRPWGPADRLTEEAREIIEERLPFDDDEPVTLEIEVWPTTNTERRNLWSQQTEARIAALDGQVIDRSSIAKNDFIYEAILASLPTHAVRSMLENPAGLNGLATLEGVQLILPQTIGQAPPGDLQGEDDTHDINEAFDVDAPTRCALLDGAPVAGHQALDGGVVIEDINDLISHSPVEQRYHATAMASLILRGDLAADGVPLKDTRIISVPVLVDTEDESITPGDRLFVDLIHTTLTRLFSGENPLAADVFVVNFSIGISDMRFAGRMSALARLMDWWSVNEGVLFVISAGNIRAPLDLEGIGFSAFEDSTPEEQRETSQLAIKASVHDRTLLAPAEAVNAIAIGAVSMDMHDNAPHDQAGIIALEDDGETKPQITSALGLGLHRSIKPDFLQVGGKLEVRALPRGHDSRLAAVLSQRTGLIVASPRVGQNTTQKTKGTSPAAALTTRAILQSAEALTIEGGPYEGLELPRKTLSLLTRALAVNASRWPDEARALYEYELDILGQGRHSRAKEEVCRYYGYGSLNPELMHVSPGRGVTIIGTGLIRKDKSLVFKLPLPDSMSGERVPRSMLVTIAWYSPVSITRAQYRLASLEAVAADGLDGDEEQGWGLNLKSYGPDANIIKRGSVWSKRMVHSAVTVPGYDENTEIPICVQCRDTSNGGLSPDEDIEFAIVVSLELEAEVQYDIHEEIEQRLRLRVQRGS